MDEPGRNPGAWAARDRRPPHRLARERVLHLELLEAVAGRTLLERSYAAALAHGYLWHEFGDLHLILP